MIITDNAKKMIEIHNVNKEKYLRVLCKGGGCSGFLVELDFTGNKNKDDLEFTSNGISILIDFKSHIFLEGTTINYTEGINGKFEYSIPSASKSCGCSKSFGI